MNLETLYKISYGMYVICSHNGERLNGQIANALIQITAEPATVAISINKKNLTHEFIQASQVLTVSILNKETPLKFIGHFGFRTGRDFDKFAGLNYKTGALGAPIVLDNTLAYLEVAVANQMDCGTHTIYFGQVREGEILLPDAEPMTYAYYHYVKRGTSPETAPTYIKAESKGGN